MLKIKENVDLKELEKFGFTKKYKTYTKKCMGIYDTSVLSINGGIGSSRTICCALWKANEITLDTIYDLIQAGLVEKVEE